jgi:hypothetical protein
MHARTLVWLGLAVATAACARAEKKPVAAQRPNWLFDVPYIAQSRLLDTTGTPEAQHVVLQVPAPIDSVASFYRHGLPPMGWTILNDAHDSIHVALYLERHGLPMWIQIEAQGPESRVSFTAAGGARRPAAPAAPLR